MKYLYFIFKNITRKKVRASLTILSIMVAFILFGFLKSISGAFDRGAQIEGEDRLTTINKVSLIQPLPSAYLQKVRALDGVDKATGLNWFGGYFQEKKNQFPQFPVDADDYLEIYRDTLSVPKKQLADWKQDRIGAVVGRALIDKYHWKIGDRIPITSMWPQKTGGTTWEFVIRGIYDVKAKGFDSNAMFFHTEYFDQGRQYGEGNIGWMVIRVKNPKAAAKVAAAIDALFENSSSETKTTSEKDFAKSFAKQLGDIGLIVTLILGAVFFTMLLVVGNTMAQSFRERIPEFAILKTLGFSNKAVMLLVLSESIILCLIGGVLGLLFAKVGVAVMGVALASFLPGLSASWVIMLQGFVLIILFGLITGFIPALQGLRLNIVNALRRS